MNPQADPLRKDQVQGGSQQYAASRKVPPALTYLKAAFFSLATRHWSEARLTVR